MGQSKQACNKAGSGILDRFPVNVADVYVCARARFSVYAGCVYVYVYNVVYACIGRDTLCTRSG